MSEVRIMPDKFRDVRTGKLVTAIVIPHDPSLGETQADDAMVTIPANQREIEQMAVNTVTGLWPVEDFNKRFDRQKQ